MSLCEMCIRRGICCVFFPLIREEGYIRFPKETLKQDVEKLIEDYNLPFVVRNVGMKDDVQDGKEFVWFGCDHLTKGGFCDMHDNRPDTCKNYEAGRESTCIMTPSFDREAPLNKSREEYYEAYMKGTLESWFTERDE